MKRALVIGIFVLTVLSAFAEAQPIFTDVFPPEEFASRRARVMEKIGDGAAILQGSPERPGEQPFRQGNQFFYLTGVEVPRAIIVIDGRTKRSTLFLLPKTDRRDRGGLQLFPGDEAVRATGIEAVVPRDEFGASITTLAREGRTIYTPFRPEVLGSASASDVSGFAAATAADPWDGRPSREAAFVQKLHSLGSKLEVRNLDPIVDAMRFIKSPREIEILREAGRIAGEGIMEAMREAAPGKYEYELQAAAEYVYRANGAQGPAYFALIGAGPNTRVSFYHRGTSRMRDGDLIRMDYGPDSKYYVSDIIRTFPVNGKFSPWQREFYTIYMRLFQALLGSIRPRVAPRDITKDAVAKMDSIFASFKFTDPKIKDAASRFIDRLRSSRANSLGHAIGMEVHDVGIEPETLQPGQAFAVEPGMSIPDEQISIGLEDSLLITETGCESLTGFVPVEIEAIEKIMAEPGLRDGRPKKVEPLRRR